VKTARHPVWSVPVYSLYGDTRRPTPAMLRRVDALVFDLQDLGARPYTYVATLRGVLEAAAAAGKPVVVADRPVPLPEVVDGPLPEPGYESFVCPAPLPMHYGMTPGETALWMRDTLSIGVDLEVAPMRHYGRNPRRACGWPPWIPPSPGIRCWEAGAVYTATVFCEALPALDNGRGTGLAFRVLGAPWLNPAALCEALSAAGLRGVHFHPHPFVAAGKRYAGRLLNGVRLTVVNPVSFRPVTTALTILACLQRLYGRRRVWQGAGSRPEFFDRLFGGRGVREALLDGCDPAEIAAGARRGAARFRRQRRDVLLYRST